MGKETEGIVYGTISLSAGSAGSSRLSDAASALAVLGYTNAEISTALKNIDVENTPVETVIKTALKNMMK